MGDPPADSWLLCYRLEPWPLSFLAGPQGLDSRHLFPRSQALAQTTAGFTLHGAMLRLRSGGRGLPQGHSDKSGG